MRESKDVPMFPIQSRFRVLMTKNLKKTYSWKFFYQKLQFTYHIPSLGLHKGRPSYRKSLQPSKREHPTLQSMKFLNPFCFGESTDQTESGTETLVFTVCHQNLEPGFYRSWNPDLLKSNGSSIGPAHIFWNLDIEIPGNVIRYRTWQFQTKKLYKTVIFLFI